MSADPSSGRPARALSVRARLTMATTGVVAIALALGATLLVVVLHAMLLRQRDDAARGQALGVAALVTSGRVPDPLPSGGTTVVQVVDAQGRVTATSPGGDRLVPLLGSADLALARAGAAVELPGRRLGIDEPLRVVAVPAAGPNGSQTVLVAAPVGDLESGLGVVSRAVAVAVVLLVGGVAVLSRWLVGSALRPVEELTRGAADLPAAPEAREVLPVPAADDEVRRLAVTLNDMIERIRASSRRQRAFVADAAHELRSPLASIRTGVEVARLHPGDADWCHVADGVLDDTDRMSRLVDDLLLLARLDEGRVAASSSPGASSAGESSPGAEAADAAVVAEDVVERLGRQVPDGVGLTRTGVRAARTTATRDTVDRITVNLVENAVRYARSRVEVCVDERDGHVLLVVTDDGPGVPVAERERVFERFTRLDGDRSRASGGSGLGLAIVRELAGAAGGGVHLEDAGPGLRAVVTLPSG